MIRLTATESTIVLNALNAADQHAKGFAADDDRQAGNVASDDPAAAAMQVQTADQTVAGDQFLRSISSVTGELQTADSALSSCVTALQRAITLGVEGANGTLSQQRSPGLGERGARHLQPSPGNRQSQLQRTLPFCGYGRLANALRARSKLARRRQISGQRFDQSDRGRAGTNRGHEPSRLAAVFCHWCQCFQSL